MEGWGVGFFIIVLQGSAVKWIVTLSVNLYESCNAPESRKFCHWLCLSNFVNKHINATTSNICSQCHYPLDCRSLYYLPYHFKFIFKYQRIPLSLSCSSGWTAGACVSSSYCLGHFSMLREMKKLMPLWAISLKPFTPGLPQSYLKNMPLKFAGVPRGCCV